jgi:hypothetical protein
MHTSAETAAPLAAPRAPAHPRDAQAPGRTTAYRHLVLGVLAVNLLVLVVHVRHYDWRIGDGSAMAAFADLTLLNVAVAVVVRQQPVLNLVYGLAGRGSPTWPLRIRWSISKVHHIGGIHAGSAIAGTSWMWAFAVAAAVTHLRHPALVSPTALGLAVAIAVVLGVVTAGAAPPVRARAHDVFEQTHRWGGWSALALFWALTIELAVDGRGEATPAVAIATDWHAWVLVALTACIAWPWLRLRRVPITVHRPSSHVAVVELDYGVRPDYSSAVGISRTPLGGWHAFATITTPGRPGYRLVISRAGDWTGRFIDDPPTHVWVRGIPVSAPMARTANLYSRVVYVVTGSGIGPILGQVLADRVPSRLVWSTRDPRRTYGDALVDEVATIQPHALIWDTTSQGKPDLLRLALDTCADFAAEAVIIVSNKATTLRLVDDLERRGIPAFGPIWDS